MEEAFEGIIKYNFWLLLIDVFLIIAFLSGWYYQYRKTGSYIDYWYYNMFLSFFIPILIMYPFGSSSLNIFTVLGPDNLYIIERHINEAYIITLAGFFGVYIGKYAFDYYHPLMVVESIISVFSSTLGKFFIKATENTRVSAIFILSYIFLLAGFICIMGLTGQILNPRLFFMLNKQYAPIYTFILSTFEVAFLVVSTRSLQYNYTLDKFLLVILCLFGFFLGVRAPIILGGLSFGILYVIYKKNGYVPFFKISVFISIMLVLIMALAFIRNSSKGYDLNLDIALQSFIPEIFYGNTFSDVRDFSWVIGYWNRQYYWGLSYFAAFLSFIPSSIYPIRDIYGIGKITVGTTGLDLATHPGLRMGIFGEMFLNFGIIGVILFGFVWGYILRRLDVFTKKYATNGNVVKASSVIIYSSFISYFTVSAGFWSFYIMIFILVLLYTAARIKLAK